MMEMLKDGLVFIGALFVLYLLQCWLEDHGLETLATVLACVSGFVAVGVLLALVLGAALA